MYPTDFDKINSHEHSLNHYIEKTLAFRKRIANKDSKVLQRYREHLKPKGILDYFRCYLHPERCMKLCETSRILEKRALSDKK